RRFDHDGLLCYRRNQKVIAAENPRNSSTARMTSTRFKAGSTWSSLGVSLTWDLFFSDPLSQGGEAIGQARLDRARGQREYVGDFLQGQSLKIVKQHPLPAGRGHGLKVTWQLIQPLGGHSLRWFVLGDRLERRVAHEPRPEPLLFQPAKGFSASDAINPRDKQSRVA